MPSLFPETVLLGYTNTQLLIIQRPCNLETISKLHRLPLQYITHQLSPCRGRLGVSQESARQRIPVESLSSPRQILLALQLSSFPYLFHSYRSYPPSLFIITTIVSILSSAVYQVCVCVCKLIGLVENTSACVTVSLSFLFTSFPVKHTLQLAPN